MRFATLNLHSLQQQIQFNVKILGNKDWRYKEGPLHVCETLRKYAYSNILTILPPKNENFQIKDSDIFFIFLLKT